MYAAVEERQQSYDNPAIRGAISDQGHMVSSWRASFCFDDILGASEALRGAVRLAQRAAQASYPAVLVGETGTGKELFAHAIHNASQRRDGPFVAINCGTPARRPRRRGDVRL